MSRTQLRTQLMSSLAPLMDDDSAMEKMLVLIHAITTEDEAPCRYSFDEMARHLQVAESEIGFGKGQTIDEVMTEAEQW